MSANNANASKSTKASGSVPAGAGSASKPVPRVIGNLATQGPGESSKGGGMRLKFTPNMPTKKADPSGESQATKVSTAPKPAGSQLAERGRGRGRGRGRAGGSGGGRGAAPEMVPAGPFAMGPLAAGSIGVPRPSAFRSSQQGFGRSIGGPGAVKAAHGVTPLPRNRDHPIADDEPEVYSEEESGLTIVDLEDVKLLDSMAPDALRKEKPKVKRKVKVKAEAPDGDVDMLTVKGPPEAKVVNANQALDLSESEEEIELEDLRQHFVVNEDELYELSLESDHLYFFQFPERFPSFTIPQRDNEAEQIAKPDSPGKKVSFAEDVKAASSEAETDKPRNEGIIGQLEIHKSGAVRMKLANGNTFDVFAATQPSFLQQAVVLDNQAKTMNVLGPISRRFVATPDLDALLSQAAQATPPSKEKKMDVD